MRLLIFITIFSLGLNSNIPGFIASEKPGSLAIAVKKCPFSQNESGNGSPFSCPKNSKKGDCPKKFINRITPPLEYNLTMALECIYDNSLFDLKIDYSKTNSIAQCLIPEKPDPPWNNPLLI
jgi:hypothetical protein